MLVVMQRKKIHLETVYYRKVQQRHENNDQKTGIEHCK